MEMEMEPKPSSGCRFNRGRMKAVQSGQSVRVGTGGRGESRVILSDPGFQSAGREKVQGEGVWCG